MIRRIALQNYMSHAHTIIEPAVGLTVLVGPNNCGKSAVVSALDTLCNNASGDYMVRHDQKEALVMVETDDGHTFLWRRKGRTVSYVIDGREIHRVKRDVPEDLHKLLRLPKVEAGESGEPFDIHFGTQKLPIFLLNEPESRAALFFASSSDAAILLEMQKRHRSKVMDRKRDENRLKKEIEKLDAELAVLKPLDTLAESVAQVDAQYKELKELESQIKTLGTAMEALRGQLVKHERLVEECQCLAPLEPPPDLADTSFLESLIADLVKAECQIQRDDARYRALEGLAPPPVLDDVQKLAVLYQTLSKEEVNHRKLEAKAVCLSLLNEPPIFDDIGSLKKIVTDLESAQLTHAALCKQLRVLRGLMLPPELADPKPLAELINKLEGASRDTAQHEGVIETTAAEMTELEGRLRNADGVGADSLLPGPAGGRSWKRALLTLAGSTGMPAIILLCILGLLFVLKPAWFGRLDTSPLDRKHEEVDSTATVVAKADDNGKARIFSVPPQTAEKGPPKERKKEELKKEELSEVKQLRLKQVRQLLNDADMANEKGKYLDAVLGFGQAAVLYPHELAEVENPEKVRLKFIEALKRYQVEVEQALQKAAKDKAAHR